MNLLAFDTSTETMSVAVTGPGAGPALAMEAAGGPQASAGLLPAIQALLAQAGLSLPMLDAIVFGRGPGSFTGLRTACAVAQGLGFGSGVPVLALDTLLAVAEEAHARSGRCRFVAVLDARMGEVYAAAYQRGDDGSWQTVSEPALLRPQDVQVPAGWAVAGTGLALLDAATLGDAVQVPARPTASALLRLAPAALAAGPAHPAAQALPLYLRDKVAQTTEERAVERARKDNPGGGSSAGRP